MDFANLNWEHGYKPWPAYRRTKLANLLFGFELERRLERAYAGAQPPAISLVVHPGVSNTNLFAAGPGSGSWPDRENHLRSSSRSSRSRTRRAHWPTLYAAASPNIQRGHFYGPNGFREMRGYPVEVKAEAQAYDEKLAAKLWEVSEQVTGVHYPLP